MRTYQESARVFKALCDPKRLAILEQLRSGEKCACVLQEPMDLTQSGLSYHMKILCDSGLVVSRQEGKWTHYRLSETGKDEAVLGGNNPFGVVLATLVGIPMYADIFGTIPVAEALLYKGAQLGTILSFMMAVTTLSLPSLIMLRKAVKPKLLALFIGICTIGIILVGYLFNAFQFLLI